MWFVATVMTTVVGVGIWQGQWMVAASGVFSLGMLVFSAQVLYRPLRWLKKRGIPVDLFFEAQQIRRRDAERDYETELPKAAVVAERVCRADSYVRVKQLSQTPSGRFQDADVRAVYERSLAWLDTGEYDLLEVAELGIAYFDAVVATAQKYVMFEDAGKNLRGYAELLDDGVGASDITEYMAVLGADGALPFLRDGIPLEFARVVVGDDRD